MRKNRSRGGFNFESLSENFQKVTRAGQKGQGKNNSSLKKKKVVHPEILELRKLRKKIRAIESLEMSMNPLKPEQKKKVAQKKEILKMIHDLEEKHPQCKPPVKKGGQNQRPVSIQGSPYRQQVQQKPKVIVLESKVKVPPQAQLKNLTTKAAKAAKAKKSKTSSSSKKTETFTAVKKRLKAIKKDLKKIEGYERQVGLGQVLASNEKALLESKQKLQTEKESLKIKRQKMLEDGLLTQTERISILEKVRKQIVSCNELETKLMKGGKLSAEEKKILDSKHCYMKEFAHLNSLEPIPEQKAVKDVTKKSRTLGDFPKEIQTRLFEIDMQLSQLKHELKEANELEIRFNKKGGKPLTPKEVRKVNRIESMEKRIEKLENEQESLIREHS